jgi:hypothetical protein
MAKFSGFTQTNECWIPLSARAQAMRKNFTCRKNAMGENQSQETNWSIQPYTYDKTRREQY